ncbi:hypothetical protein FCV25MIE_30960 [Fagus crenata]
MYRVLGILTGRVIQSREDYKKTKKPLPNLGSHKIRAQQKPLLSHVPLVPLKLSAPSASSSVISYPSSYINIHSSSITTTTTTITIIAIAMDHNQNSPPSPSSSLKQKLKSTLCCFPMSLYHQQQRDDSFDSDSESRQPRLFRSSSMKIKPRGGGAMVHDINIPEIKDKCKNFMSRIGGRHGRRHSADFKYDPLSYSLNFDEGNADADPTRHSMELPPIRNFTSRLPPSPPSREIAAYS